MPGLPQNNNFSSLSFSGTKALRDLLLTKNLPNPEGLGPYGNFTNATYSTASLSVKEVKGAEEWQGKLVREDPNAEWNEVKYKDRNRDSSESETFHEFLSTSGVIRNPAPLGRLGIRDKK